MDEEFKITPELLQRRHKRHVEKERLLFLALCSEKDRQLINGKIELNVNEYERICYLLETLGFNDFLLQFELAHEDLLMELGTQIEKDVNMSDELDISEIIDTTNQWLRNFCEELPSPVIKQYIKTLFYLE